jgi:hypothetical protein
MLLFRSSANVGSLFKNSAAGDSTYRLSDFNGKFDVKCRLLGILVLC